MKPFAIVIASLFIVHYFSGGAIAQNPRKVDSLKQLLPKSGVDRFDVA